MVFGGNFKINGVVSFGVLGGFGISFDKFVDFVVVVGGENV